MSDRVCVRGCTQRGVHYASCVWAHVEDTTNTPDACRGCAEEPARDGVMICDRCYRRFRFHLSNAPDLVGRLRSFTDPSIAKAYDDGRSGAASTKEGLEKLADLIDAAQEVMKTLRQWAVYVDPRSGVIGGMPAGAGAAGAYEYAHRCSEVILGGFDRLANNRDDIVSLGEGVLDRHHPDPDGVRSGWSIVDAVARYRLERPSADVVLDAEEDRELFARGVPEWDRPLVTASEALQITGRAASTLARWVADGHLKPAMTYGPRWFYRADVERVSVMKRGNKGGRPKREPEPTEQEQR